MAAMADRSSNEGHDGGRVETLIRVLAPFLDAVLFVGDRVSRVLVREDPDYVAPRMIHGGESAPRGLRSRG